MAAKKKPSRGEAAEAASRRGDWFIPAVGSSRFTSFDAAAREAGWINKTQGKAFLVKVVEESSRSRPGERAYQVYLKATPAYLKILRENGGRSSARRSSKRRTSKAVVGTFHIPRKGVVAGTFHVPAKKPKRRTSKPKPRTSKTARRRTSQRR